MENRQYNEHNFDPREHKLAASILMGGAALASFIALNAGNETIHQKETHSQMESQPLHDTSSTVIDVSSYTPISSEPRHFITIQETPSGPDTVPNDEQLTITLTVPADVANSYHEGQVLSPQQTNDLIDNN